MTSHTGSDDPHSRLDELRTATIRRAASLVSSFDGIVEAASDVATDDEHDPEGHTIAWERQQIAALLDETTNALTAIEAAEQRLDEGLYGTCTTCGLTIAVERLDALPATQTCVNCASELCGDRRSYRQSAATSMPALERHVSIGADTRRDHYARPRRAATTRHACWPPASRS